MSTIDRIRVIASQMPLPFVLLRVATTWTFLLLGTRNFEFKRRNRITAASGDRTQNNKVITSFLVQTKNKNSYMKT